MLLFLPACTPKELNHPGSTSNLSVNITVCFKIVIWLGVAMTHAFNFSTQEAEKGGHVWV